MHIVNKFSVLVLPMTPAFRTQSDCTPVPQASATVVWKHRGEGNESKHTELYVGYAGSAERNKLFVFNSNTFSLELVLTYGQ